MTARSQSSSRCQTTDTRGQPLQTGDQSAPVCPENGPGKTTQKSNQTPHIGLCNNQMTVSTCTCRKHGARGKEQEKVPSNEHDDCTASERTAHIRITSFVAEEQRNVVFVFSSAARRRRRCRLRPSLHSCSLPLHRRRRRRRHISFLIGAIVVTVVRRSFACVVVRLWFVVRSSSFVVVRSSSFVVLHRCC